MEKASCTISGDVNDDRLFQGSKQEENVMMWWVPGIPEWSGSLPTIAAHHRQLPNGCGEKTHRKTQCSTHEVMGAGSQRAGIV